MLEVKSLATGYEGKIIVEDINFTVQEGEIFGILGPNGSGKTTLLKAITGHLPLYSGSIHLLGQSLKRFAAKELAKQIAVLPQQSELSFDYTVEETVQLGRYPYQKGFFSKFSEADQTVCEQVMKQTDIAHLKNHSFQQLSGGERQRVLLARALCQEPKLLMLDEPTNHLDIAYQMQLFDSLKQWTLEKKLTVVGIFHDLNLASLYCDRILLLNAGKMVALSEPSEVLNEQILEDVYHTTLKRKDHPELPKPLITLLPNQSFYKPVSFFDLCDFTQDEQMIRIDSPKPFRTLSSGVIGEGFGWRKTFINRHVSKWYDHINPVDEFEQFLEQLHLDKGDVVGMMTAAILEDASIMQRDEDLFKLWTIVTAGVSNAVDVANSYVRNDGIYTPGTINILIIIEGKLTDAAFVQAMMTATEAKVKAVMDEGIKDPVTHTQATGTSTDSVLVAATQTGETLDFAGTITPIGKAIGSCIYQSTRLAIQRNKKRWS